MKKLISSLGLAVVAVLMCSFQATAQYRHGNGHHGNWDNNGNGRGNNCGNNGGYNTHCNNNSNYNNNCGNNSYSYSSNHCHNSGYSMSFGYTYPTPCFPRTVVVYRQNHCAPKPHCRRW